MEGTSIGWRQARRRLLDWFRRRARDLPWRRTREPYAIWVSEVMLQQTRVAAVVPYYRRFLARFPDVETLARARLDTVLGLWAGLGYYRRARNLHRAARIVVAEGFPESSAGWRRLPGVGEYTAAAIASIVLRERAAVVDGNVERVVSRLLALRRDRASVRRFVDGWLSARAPGRHNQALMELGATICRPRGPDCSRCPLHAVCAGRHDPERYPAPRPRPVPRPEVRAVAFVVRDGKVLLQRHGPGGPLEGLWDLPPARPAGEPLATVRHGIMDRRIEVRIHDGVPLGGGQWFSRRRLASLPLATAGRKALRRLGFLRAE